MTICDRLTVVSHQGLFRFNQGPFGLKMPRDFSMRDGHHIIFGEGTIRAGLSQ